MSFAPGQSVSASGFPPMVVESIVGGLVICTYMAFGSLQRVQLQPYLLSLATPQAPVGLNPGPVTITLGSPDIATLLGFNLTYPLQSVVAAAGAVPYTFASSPGSGGNACVGLVANGVSAAPAVSGMSPLDQSTYNNTAGVLNFLLVQSDQFGDVFYNWQMSLNLLPTPTAFVAALNGTSVTVTIGGALLGAVTPPLGAFTLVATRSSSRAPYSLSSVNAVNSGDTQVVLNISGGTFQSGDVVQLSYQPPASSPLQDTSKACKTAMWIGAAVTVQ